MHGMFKNPVTFSNWLPFSHTRYWTGTSLKWRLMRGNIKKRLMSFTFEKTFPHEPRLQAGSSPILGI